MFKFKCIKYASVLVLILLAWTLVASASTILLNFGGPPITISLSAEEDAAVLRVLVARNAERARLIPPLPAQLPAEWFRDVILSTLRQYGTEAAVLEQRDACENYRALTTGQQTTIRGLLGGKSPCF